MARRRLTARKRVVVPPQPVLDEEWKEQQPVEMMSHGDGHYFPDTLWRVQQGLGYHHRPEYVGIRTPVADGSYRWSVSVRMFERITTDGLRRVRRIHQATAPRSTFEEGMKDAARQALAVLRHEEEVMAHTQYRYFASRPSCSLVEKVESANGEEDSTFRETIRYAKALNNCLTEALEELAQSRKREQELEAKILHLEAVINGDIEEDEPMEMPDPVPVPPCSPTRLELRRALAE